MHFTSTGPLCSLLLSSSLVAARAVIGHDAPEVPGVTVSATGVLSPKLMIISLFSPEEAAWPEHVNFYANNITVPGLSPLFPDVHCTSEGDICQFTTGEGLINSASSTAALMYSNMFDLTQTYFFIAGVAGINPNCGTLGSVSLSRYVVQTDLQYLIDPRELPEEDRVDAGFIPLGTSKPGSYPVYIYGTEAFELNRPLLDRAYTAMQKANLTDSEQARNYSSAYPEAVTKNPPQVFKGEIGVTDVYFHGDSVAEAFGSYVNMLTNGTGEYCMSAQEDSGILESIMRADIAKKADFSRIVAMRVGINFDRPPPGESSVQQLFVDQSGGPAISFPNIYNAGIEFVNDVINNWDSVYQQGIVPDNYIGDLLDSLHGPIKPDIGSAYSQQG